MICFCPHLSHSRSRREGRYRHQNSCFSHFTLSFGFCHILQMPDVSVILCNRSVGREKSGFGNVHQHFFLPRFFIFIIRKHLLFCSDIIFHIQSAMNQSLPTISLYRRPRFTGSPMRIKSLLIIKSTSSSTIGSFS